MQLQIEVVKKNEVAGLSDEDLVLKFEQVLYLEKLVKELKSSLRNEIISRYGVNAVHQVGDKKLIIEERERNVLDSKAVKVFLSEIGKLDDFMRVSKAVYVYVK